MKSRQAEYDRSTALRYHSDVEAMSLRRAIWFWVNETFNQCDFWRCRHQADNLANFRHDKEGGLGRHRHRALGCAD